MNEVENTHEDNIKKEFEQSQGADTDTVEASEVQRTPDGKISSLGKVDTRKGRGVTPVDDPEIKRIQELVGYIEFDLAQLPSGGKFYRDDFQIHIRAARVGEIRNFSTMDENHLKDVDDKLNDILLMCTKLTFGKSVGSYKDILEEDRIYLLLAIRELTFKDGEAKLMLKSKTHECPTRGSVDKVELRTENLDFQLPEEQVMRYYDEENKCYAIQTKSYGEIRMAPPTIGVMRAVTNYITKREEEGTSWDKSSLQVIPYIIREWRGWTDRDIFATVTEFQGWEASKYSVIFRLAEKMKVGVKPELKHICPGCGTEVSAPLEFPDGIKSLFVIPDISGELL
jgi:hypothetical protein